MTDYKALRETLERLVIHRRDGNITSDYFFSNFEPILPQILAALRLAEVVPEVEEALVDAVSRIEEGVEDGGDLEPDWSISDRKFVSEARLTIAKLQSAKEPPDGK
jgi:hypothetical protein